MNKKLKIYVSIAILAILVLLGGAIFIVTKTSNKPNEALSKYFDLINDKNYEGMYEMISSESQEKISKDDFIKRNKNIYEGIEAKDIKIDISKVTSDGGDKKIDYTTSITVMGSELTFDNSIKMKNENKSFSVIWESKVIYPELDEVEKVSVKTNKAKRGEILDRNGKALATDGLAANVGIVPGKLSANQDEAIASIASILEISADDIKSKLKASYVKSDMFVPIKVISSTDTRKQSLLQIPGIMINDKAARVYPLGEDAAHLTGYVQNINAEELEEYSDKNYRSDSVIGKTGLEKIYEDKIRGIDGFEINIVDMNGKKVSSIISKEPQNGSDLKLTIDSNMQSLLYGELSKDKGTSVAMNPNTGEVLALVSTPGYDPNDFVMGISTDKWNSLNNDINKPLYNRFSSKVVPGSIFKPLTAAIGLDSKTLDPNGNKNISGLKWQKDSSWGDYSVTRVSEYGGGNNLLNALVYSDNIYFAQTALDIGKDTFAEKLKSFGFGEELPFEYGMTKSQIASDGNIKTEVQLADSGYGQGEVLVNPVHLASIYTAFLNQGNIISPYLEYKNNPESKIWKENAISKESANLVLQNMIQVVENTGGTGHEAQTSGLTIAAKTGTAEIKASQDDTTGTELGWFAAMTTNKDKNNLLVVIMAEDVKDRGGSHYVIPKVKKALETVK
ncbi:penicillin-binding transpeptidase domain-containing protein [Clostridium paraputrificum]|uniref:penicillin-binding transpeptidase domain-containing protein n=1 Tax=Clostridium paraputrificum TaxID=29363 RepID=UPI003D3545B4